MDDQRCHVTLSRQNNGMFGFFWYVSVIQSAADLHRQTGQGDKGSWSLLLGSFFSGEVSVHDQGLLGRGSLTRSQSFETV